MENKKIIGILGMAGFVVVADNWVVSPILPAISNNLHIDISSTGLLITAYMAPFAAFQLLFGPLSDRLGKKQVITCSMIVFTIATALCALGFGLTPLAFFRSLTGIFAASVMPISIALIGDLFPITERHKAVGTFLGISFLGQGFSMAIGGATAFLVSWRGVFILYAILSIIPTMALVRIYGSLPTNKNPHAEFVTPYVRLLAGRQSLSTYVMICLEGFFIIGSFSYLGAYISVIYHYDSLIIGLIMTGFGLATVVAGRLSGKLVEVFGPRQVLTFGLLSASIALLLLASYGHRIGYLLISIALLGFGFMFTHATLITRLTEFAKKARGAAMSLGAFSFMSAGALGTAIGSVLVDHGGLSKLFTICGVAMFVVWLVSFILIGRTRVHGQ
ncbi:MAG: MFS transporter [Deltaproteobacteria bacterium]|nr:MFS transporter [Deltaproteobacteria bacterium]